MQEEMTEIQEEVTTEPQEQTQTQTQELEQNTSSTLETTTTTALIDVAEGFPDNSDSELHELFAGLGVNLDYVPKNPYQCFSMALSCLCALWFCIWFCKFLYALSRDILK